MVKMTLVLAQTSIIVDRAWSLILKHCYRKANKCADAFARQGALMNRDIVIFTEPPSDIDLLLRLDTEPPFDIDLLLRLDADGTLYD